MIIYHQQIIERPHRINETAPRLNDNGAVGINLSYRDKTGACRANMENERKLATEEELARLIQTIKDMPQEEALKIADNFKILSDIIKKWHSETTENANKC